MVILTRKIQVFIHLEDKFSENKRFIMGATMKHWSKDIRTEILIFLIIKIIIAEQ